MKNPYQQFDEYGLRHLPRHLIDLEQWSILETFLTDLYFIETKCAIGMTYDLIENYNAILDVLPEAQENLRRPKRLLLDSFQNPILWFKAQFSRLWKSFPCYHGLVKNRFRKSSQEEKQSEDERAVQSIYTLQNLCRFFSRHAILIDRNPKSIVPQFSCDFHGISETLDALMENWEESFKIGNLCYLRRANTSLPFRSMPMPLRLPYENPTFTIEYIESLNALILASHAGDIAVYDIETEQCLNWKLFGPETLWSIALGPEDSLYCIFEGKDNVLALNLPQLTPRKTIPVLVEEPRWLTTCKVSNRLAIGGLNTVQIYDPVKQQSRIIDYPARKQLQLPYWTNMLLFSSSGRFLAAACGSGDVIIFDFLKDRFLPVKGYCGEGAMSLAFDCSENILYVGSGDGQILRWHIPTDQISLWDTEDQGVESLLLIDQDTILLSGHRTGNIRAWKESERKAVTTVALGGGYILALSGLPGRKGVFAASRSTGVLRLPPTVEAIQSLPSGEINAFSASISEEHRTLIVARDTGAVVDFDTDKAEIKAYAPIGIIDPSNFSEQPLFLLWANLNQPSIIPSTIYESTPWKQKQPLLPIKVVCGIKGNICFMGCSDGSLFVYNISSKNVLAFFQGNSIPLTNLAYSFRSNRVAFITDVDICGFDVDTVGNITNRHDARLSCRPKDYALICFLHDEFLLVDVGRGSIIDGGRINTGDSCLHIRRFKDFSLLSECPVDRVFVVSIYCATTGDLYLGEGDETIINWTYSNITDDWDFKYHHIFPYNHHYQVFRIPLEIDSQSVKFVGKPEKFCEGHRSPLVGMTVVDDGKFLATSSKDGNIRLWSTSSGKLVSEVDMKGHTLFGPYLVEENVLFCVDSGPGNQNRPEIYHLWVENRN